MQKTMIQRMVWRLLLATLLLTAAPAWADFDVTIGSGASANGAWSGATPDVWIPSGSGATVSVAEVQARLASGGATIATAAGSGNGDIIITAPLAWNGNTLTLTASRNIQINAVMTASGSAALTMSGTPLCSFASGGGFSGRVDYGASGALTINGSPYTVITSLGSATSSNDTTLQGIKGALSGKFALGADIDASATWGWSFGVGFTPIGSSSSGFSGTFDGLGHSINRMHVNRSSASGSGGLFGDTSGALLRNVGVNISIFSSMADGFNIGGLVGAMYGGSINNCYSSGSVTATSTYVVYAGGLVGYLEGGSITGSCSSTAVTAFAYATGVYPPRSASGGLVGVAWSGTISNCYSSGSSTAYTFAGGTGSAYSGGLVGDVVNGSFNNSYSNVSVTSKAISPSSAVLYPYSGGLVGRNTGGSISNCYSTGWVSGVSPYGLLAANSGPVSSSFWDTQSSGTATSWGGSGKTTAEMKSLATFAGWDISEAAGSGSLWRMVDGVTYPQLRIFSPQLNLPTSTIVIDPTSPTTLYAGLDGAGIYKSTDSGQSWSPANPQPGNKGVKAMVIKPGAGSTLYAATYGGGVYTSSNGGAGWAVCSDGATANSGLGNLNVLSLVSDASGKLYAGTEGGVFVSSDGCATWQALDSGLPN